MSIENRRKRTGERAYGSEKVICKGGCGKSRPLSGYLRYDTEGRFREELYVWYCDECDTKRNNA